MKYASPGILIIILLYSAGIAFASTPEPQLELTQEESNWLAANPNVKFTGDPNWLPYEAFDANGNYIGIVAEHLKIISKLSGIKFVMSPSSTWTESTEKAKQGTVDVLSETDDSDLKSHLNFTQPYISNPIVIAMHNRENYVENINSIKDKRIALIKDYGYASKIRRKYSNIEFVTVADIQDGLIAVSTGEIDALLCTLALCSYTIADLNINNVRITGKTEFDTKLALGVQKNLPVLLSILNKAIKQIDRKQQQQIVDKWIKEKYIERIDYTLVYQILAASLILLSIFFFWNRRLSREVLLRKIAEKELNEHQEQLEDLVQQRTASMERARDEAEKANNAKSEFLSRMSHELRTPLNAILGFSQLLELDNKNLTDDQRDQVEEILGAGHHLLLLIDEVLDLARIESGSFELQISKINIDNVLQKCLSMAQPFFDDKEIQLTNNLSGHNYSVMADETRLKQVLLNLLTNAAKYNKKKGSITIDSEIRKNNRLRVMVSDTGSGIRSDQIHKLFIPFERFTSPDEIQGSNKQNCSKRIQDSMESR